MPTHTISLQTIPNRAIPYQYKPILCRTKALISPSHINNNSISIGTKYVGSYLQIITKRVENTRNKNNFTPHG